MKVPASYTFKPLFNVNEAVYTYCVKNVVVDSATKVLYALDGYRLSIVYISCLLVKSKLIVFVVLVSGAENVYAFSFVFKFVLVA